MRNLTTLCLTLCLSLSFAAQAIASDSASEVQQRIQNAIEKVKRLQSSTQGKTPAATKKQKLHYGQMLVDIENKSADWKKDPNSMLKARKLNLALESVEEILESPIPQDQRQNENLNPAHSGTPLTTKSH